MRIDGSNQRWVHLSDGKSIRCPASEAPVWQAHYPDAQITTEPTRATPGATQGGDPVPT